MTSDDTCPLAENIINRWQAQGVAQHRAPPSVPETLTVDANPEQGKDDDVVRWWRRRRRRWRCTQRSPPDRLPVNTVADSSVKIAVFAAVFKHPIKNGGNKHKICFKKKSKFNWDTTEYGIKHRKINNIINQNWSTHSWDSRKLVRPGYRFVKSSN